MPVVGPHAVKRQLVLIKPLRLHLLGLSWLTDKIVHPENMNFQYFRIAFKFKLYNANFIKITNLHSRFFFCLAPQCFFYGFPLLQFSAKTVPPPRAKSPFFHAQKNFVIFMNYAKS